MHESLDKYLCDKYPKIFSERCKSPQETCMCWGFPDDGWFFLIDSLCDSIQRHIDNPPMVPAKSFSNFIKWPFVWLSRWTGWYRLQPRIHYVPKVIPQVVARQVKEKFGGLRFYVSGGDDETGAMISFAERMSYSICENCGVMNEEVICTGRGWVTTLCLKCRKPEETDVHLEAQKEFEEKILAWDVARKDKANDPDPVKTQYDKAMAIVKKWQGNNGNR